MGHMRCLGGQISHCSLEQAVWLKALFAAERPQMTSPPGHGTPMAPKIICQMVAICEITGQLGHPKTRLVGRQIQKVA